MRHLRARSAAVLLLLAFSVPLAAQQNPAGAGARARAAAEARQQAREARQARLAARTGPEATARITRTIRLERGATFDVSNVAGAITITGGGGNEIRIDAVKRARGRNDAEARGRLADLDVEIRELGTRVEVRTQYLRGLGPANGAVDYTIALPQDADVVVKSVAGDIRAVDIRGTLRLETAAGSIDATRPRRLEAVRSVSGDVQITDAEAQDIVTLRTVSGDLVVRGLKARAIDASSVSGDVRLDAVESQRVDLRTVSGTIDYGGRLARRGRYEMTTHSGDVRLAITDSGFDVEANTFNGDFRSDYDLTLRGGGAGDRAARGRRARTRATLGSYGDGSAILALRSFNGDITITRR